MAQRRDAGATKPFVERPPGPKSERVVVDELFDNGTVRLLRSKRLSNQNGFGIETWGEEKEDFMQAWRVEAFVGYTGGRSLAEGDVFFLADGSKLNDKYAPIEREAARQKHLLKEWEASREEARKDIKEQFFILTATQVNDTKEEDLPVKDKESIQDRILTDFLLK